MKYQRILLKISGEALKGDQQEDILESKYLRKVGEMIKQIYSKDIDIGIVIGGGNIWRGRVAKDFGLDRANADYMGMTATIINTLVLNDILNILGVPCACLSALEIPGVIKKYSVEEANKLLSERKVVIFGGGTGHPFLSTDTAAAMRASEIKADVLLAGKNGAEGFYDSDPNINPNAKFFSKLTYQEIIDMNLQAMDIESIKICKENNTLIRVFNMNNLDNVIKVVDGDNMGTTIGKEK